MGTAYRQAYLWVPFYSSEYPRYTVHWSQNLSPPTITCCHLTLKAPFFTVKLPFFMVRNAFVAAVSRPLVLQWQRRHRLMMFLFCLGGGHSLITCKVCLKFTSRAHASENHSCRGRMYSLTWGRTTVIEAIYTKSCRIAYTDWKYWILNALTSVSNASDPTLRKKAFSLH